ncbi:MAG TPA: sigma-70 family RNA polymerase sigma factor [Actinomycetota bacterium]|nr:sigma-70 family RNA polymerase sigma factor [Actinomycetota bacterium]
MKAGTVPRERPIERLADFDSFFRDEFPRVVRAAALVARDLGAGEDCAQEAFLRLHQRWGRMESDAHARNFAYRAALNLARSHVRKHLRVSLSGSTHETAQSDASSATVEWLALLDAVASLSGKQRAVLALVDYLGYDADAAARTLGISPSTVRVHLKRARDAVRRHLTGGDPR